MHHEHEIDRSTIRCRLWGCNFSNGYECEWCGAEHCGYGARYSGPLMEAYYWFTVKRRWIKLWIYGPKCNLCKKPISRSVLWKSSSDWYCSEKCIKDDIPF